MLLLLSIGAFKLWKGKLWDGKSRFTIALNSDPITIFSIEPSSHKAILLTVPTNTIFEVPFGYGRYLASSVFRLGELDNKRGGGMLFSKSVENSLGIMVDAYISAKKDTFPFSIKTLQDVKFMKNNYFSFLKLPSILFSSLVQVKSYETNLSLLDFVSIWREVRSLRSDQIELIDIGESAVVSDDKLPDGVPVKTIDEEIFDFILDDNFQDISIRSEGISVEVVNATNKDKLATLVGRILKNLGANIISKTTAEKTQSYSCLIKILNKNIISKLIIKKLINHYRCQVEDDKSVDSIDRESSVDAKLFLGEGFIQ